MNKDWLILVEKFDLESARTKFQDICESLYKKISVKEPRTVRVNQGDGGIDIFIGEIGLEPIEVIQCKFFVDGLGESQKSQIRESFKTAIESKEFETKCWTLCIINILDLQQNKWWSSWKNNVEIKYNLSNEFIKLKDGNELVSLLKQFNLYNTAFELEDSIKISEIHEEIVKRNITPTVDIKSLLKNTSYALLQVKNYIENNTSTHIQRTETELIYNWINAVLPTNKRNVLVLKGEKGLGKSAILKDLYNKLDKENFTVLGIKADKFYCKSIFELEKKLFNDQLTFNRIIKNTEESGDKLVVIIDQIDAMSLTLSSSREFIETYIRLISILQENKNTRIILSSRSYDLKYDAELSIYNSDIYKIISVNPLSVDAVKNTLSKFRINCSSAKVLELLRTPNHLDIYCRIFESSIKKDVDTISSLKELYDQLWIKYISPTKDLNLKKLIYIISQRMYNEQRISVGNVYEDDYHSEIQFLSSNSLLIEYDKEVQFFHQTFYEYCFAKQFVENKCDLENYILENEQSLYVRSVIKMVLEYLREYDINAYHIKIKNVLNSKNYRFHIKSLIISELGLVKKPSISEKEIVTNIILNNTDYEEVFVSSIFSEDWIKLFISEDIPKSYFFVENRGNSEEDYNLLKAKKHNYNWLLFRNNMKECPLLILDYLDKQDFDNKNNFISSLLIQIEDWSNEKLLHYFEKYIPYVEESKVKRDNFWFYEILKKIFPTNKDYGYEKMTKPILDVYEEYNYDYSFEHSLDSTIEEFYEISPKETFEFLFKLYQQLSEKNKVDYFKYENVLSTLYGSSVFSNSDNSYITRGEKNLKSYLYKFIENSNINYVTDFYNKFKDTDNVSILKLLVRGLNAYPINHKDKVVELIEILNKKNIFGGSDDNFQLLLRNLISSVYTSLDESQTALINSTFLSIRTKYDYHIWSDTDGNRKVHLNDFGKKKYLFIKSLPIEKIKTNSTLYKTYQELERKFGEINHSKALHVSSVTHGAVGTPLNKSAYEKMDLKSWKRSMMKYDENYKSSHSFRGGIYLHSTAFKDKVKECPDKFYKFIDELFEDNRISPQYIMRGIDGLIESNYNPDRVKTLYKKFIFLNLSEFFYTSMFNHQAEYFIKNRNIDIDIVSYLQRTVVNYPHKERELNPTKPLFDSTNSVRGSALQTLMLCYYDNNFEEIIFSTIEDVIHNPLCNDSLKVMILHYLGYLNYLNIERAFKIFVELTKTDDVEILKSSINTAQYFNNKYHNVMEDYFNRLLNTSELHKQSYLLVSSWLLGLDVNKKLYKEFIKTGKDAKLCAIDVAEKFLINEDDITINENALSILYEFINETDKEFAREYSCIILRKFKPSNFNVFFDFLKVYSISELSKKEPRYFLQYLLKCSKDYPKECMDLLEYIDFSNLPNIQERGHYDKEPIQLILGIYSKLVSEVNKEKKLINKALDVFDNMLKHVHLRSSANLAIETII
ncbi:MAG TPA: ATP-binding protein [Flavobacterium sp.]|uniref:NACHT domain-containing protein n=1 Tax=unclassified Flavobacterium TaxID=196869 RepID=UPI0025BFE7D6|nr:MULTISPECIES: ATP-binding protein [unclassified Flavobacterium]HRE78473.1 ATP-binding protein [Flavobacterium sp.]